MDGMFRIGPESFLKDGDGWILDSAEEKDREFNPSRFHRTVFLFRFAPGALYFVGAKDARNGSWRYRFLPFLDSNEVHGPVITYDESYVAAMEERRRQCNRQENLVSLFTLAGPVVGLLPSPVQETIGNLGVDVHRATFQSSILELGLAIALAARGVVHVFWNGAGPPGSPPVDLLTDREAIWIVAVGSFFCVDAMIRGFGSHYGHSFRGIAPFEQISRLFARPKKRG